MQLAITSGRPQVLSAHDLACEDAGTCSLQGGIVVPITTDDVVVGALVALDSSAPASLLRLSGEVAEFVSTQLQLAELDRSRRRAVQFELRFLRAQISPHFIYNALTAIESFVRSDPDRARELLVQFADFIRYSFRSHGQFVTMAEELRLVDTYLDLERARFGDRLEVTLRVAPEVLSVMLPPFVLQPLVENAVHHGLEPSGQTGPPRDHHQGCRHRRRGLRGGQRRRRGTGSDPARPGRGRATRRAWACTTSTSGCAPSSATTSRLTIETAPGAGTRVTVRIPKYHVGVLS